MEKALCGQEKATTVRGVSIAKPILQLIDSTNR